MSELKSRVKEIFDNYNTASYDQIILVLNQIKLQLRSNITREYLEGKISKISQTTNEKEKLELINSLKPYFDWYLQGS